VTLWKSAKFCTVYDNKKSSVTPLVPNLTIVNTQCDSKKTQHPLTKVAAKKWWWQFKLQVFCIVHQALNSSTKGFTYRLSFTFLYPYVTCVCIFPCSFLSVVRSSTVTFKCCILLHPRLFFAVPVQSELPWTTLYNVSMPFFVLELFLFCPCFNTTTYVTSFRPCIYLLPSLPLSGSVAYP
jgi:hypothetical protein